MRDRAEQRLAIIRADGAGGREAILARLGLIPAWAKGPAIGSRMINARAETVTVKPAFRDAFRLRRCIVPVSGFYRWRRRGGPKQLYLIRRRDGAPMGFAGLWEAWTDPASGEVQTVSQSRRPKVLITQNRHLVLRSAATEQSSRSHKS